MNVLKSILEAALQWQRTARQTLHTGGPQGQVMLELMRPQLGGHTPLPLRRVLEPVVAACAVAVMLGLLSLGAVSFALFMLASGLIYAILTQVFGIELGVQTRRPGA